LGSGGYWGKRAIRNRLPIKVFIFLLFPEGSERKQEGGGREAETQGRANGTQL